MEASDLQRWVKLAMRRHYSTLETLINERKDGRLVFATMEMQVRANIKRCESDSSYAQLLQTYLTCFSEGKSITQTLLVLTEAKNGLYKKRSFIEQEYPSANPYDLLGYFFDDYDTRKQLKQLMRMQICYHLEQTYPAISEALKSKQQPQLDAVFDAILLRDDKTALTLTT